VGKEKTAPPPEVQLAPRGLWFGPEQVVARFAASGRMCGAFVLPSGTARTSLNITPRLASSKMHAWKASEEAEGGTSVDN